MIKKLKFGESILLKKRKHYTSIIRQKLILILPRKKKLPPLKVDSIFTPVEFSNNEVSFLYLGAPMPSKILDISYYKLLQSLSSELNNILKKIKITDKKAYIPLETSIYEIKENIQQWQKLKSFDDRTSSIINLSNIIHSSDKIEEIIKAILDNTYKILRTENASLFLLDEKTGEFYFEMITGKRNVSEILEGKRIPVGKGIVNLCAKNKRPLIVNNAQRDRRVYKNLKNAKERPTQNLIACPLLNNNECIGVIEVINTVNRKNFTQEDLQTVKAIATSVATALQKRYLLDGLKEANESLEKELRETITLHTVAGAAIEASTPKDLFQKVFQAIKSNMLLHMQAIFIFNEQTQQLDAFSTKDVEKEKLHENIPLALVEYVFQKREAIFCEDINSSRAIQEILGPKHSQKKYLMNSCILLLLKSSQADTYYGVYCIANSANEPSLKKEDYQLLLTIASELSRGYDSFKMQEKLVIQSSLEKEIEIAAQVQRDILPAPFLKHNYVNISAQANMIGNVGGDLYNYASTTPHSPVSIFIGDVSGKSIAAALFMAITSSVMKSIIAIEQNPAKVLTQANKLLYEESKRGMFVTLFFTHYNPHQNLLEYASAGHNQMLLIRSDNSHEVLSSKGLPLGVEISNEWSYVSKSITVNPKDILILYTDGITEATNRRKQEFGLTRFIDLLKENKTKSPEKIIKTIIQEVSNFCQKELLDDDITLVVSQFTMPSSSIKEYEVKTNATKSSSIQLLSKIEELLIETETEKNSINDVLLIAEEIITNIVSYAYEGLLIEEPKFNFYICIEIGKKIQMKFEDEGRSYDFNSIKAPDISTLLESDQIGGFGIHLVKSLSNKVEFTRQDEKNILFIEKVL